MKIIQLIFLVFIVALATIQAQELQTSNDDQFEGYKLFEQLTKDQQLLVLHALKTRPEDRNDVSPYYLWNDLQIKTDFSEGKYCKLIKCFGVLNPLEEYTPEIIEEKNLYEWIKEFHLNTHKQLTNLNLYKPSYNDSNKKVLKRVSESKYEYSEEGITEINGTQTQQFTRNQDTIRSALPEVLPNIKMSKEWIRNNQVIDVYNIRNDVYSKERVHKKSLEYDSAGYLLKYVYYSYGLSLSRAFTYDSEYKILGYTDVNTYDSTGEVKIDTINKKYVYKHGLPVKIETTVNGIRDTDFEYKYIFKQEAPNSITVIRFDNNLQDYKQGTYRKIVFDQYLNWILDVRAFPNDSDFVYMRKFGRQD